MMISRTVIIFFIAYMFSTKSVLADMDDDQKRVSKAIADYSILIDAAISVEPVYDRELRDSKNNLLRILDLEIDKDEVVDIIVRLLDSTREHYHEEKLEKSVVFTIKYGCNFLSQLGTSEAFDRLLDEYEYWDNKLIKDSMYYIISKAARRNINTFDSERFTMLKCDDTEDPNTCLEAADTLKNADKPKPGKGVILNGGAKVCC